MPRIPRPLLPAALVLATGIGMAFATGAETLCTLVMDAQSAAILLEQGDCKHGSPLPRPSRFRWR